MFTPAGGSGGSGTVYATSIVVSFGANFTSLTTKTVNGLAWVTAATLFSATAVALSGPSTADVLTHQFSWTFSDIVVGAGFTFSVYTPALARGDYTFHVLAVVPT